MGTAFRRAFPGARAAGAARAETEEGHVVGLGMGLLFVRRVGLACMREGLRGVVLM
jgi:hypothetical protein